MSNANPFDSVRATASAVALTRLSEHAPTGQTLQVIAIEDCEPDPKNMRAPEDPSMSEESLGELLESLEQSGQQVPIICKPKDANGKYRVIAGHRRLAALKSSKKTLTITAIVRDDINSEVDINLIQILENSQREDVLPISDADAVAAYANANGLPRAATAAKLGINEKTLERKLQAAKLPANIKQYAVNAAIMDLVAILELGKLYKENPSEAEALMNSDAVGLRDRVIATRKRLTVGETKPVDKTASVGKRGKAPAAISVEWNADKSSLTIATKTEQFRFLLDESQIVTLKEALRAPDQ